MKRIPRRGHLIDKAMERAIDLQELLGHSSWMRALARTLVRDAGFAEDVVQQTWVAALENPPRSVEARGVWLRRVVRNLSLRVRRDQRHRRIREERAARLEIDAVTPEELLQKAELQRRIVDAVIALEEPYRSSVLLRFYEDLHPREIAARLGIPAATVRTRLSRALEKLRCRFDEDHGGRREEWCLAFLPLLGLNRADLTVAANTAGALAGTPGSGGALGTVSGTGLNVVLTTGGVMSLKKTIVAFVLLALISTGSGAWIGHSCIPPGQVPPRDEKATSHEREQILVSRLDGLERERRRLEAALAKAISRSEVLEKRLAGEGIVNGVSSAQAVPTAGEEKKENGAAGSGTIDWENLHNLFKKNVDIVIRTCELEKEKKNVGENLSPEELVALKELQAEWFKTASRARLESKYPVLDSKMLPEILKASLGGLLNLSEDQLETIITGSMETPLSLEALESATPLEAYTERLDLTGRLEAILPEVLDEGQLETWRSVEQRMMSLFRGESNYTCLGLESEKKYVLDWITRDWRKHYGFPEEMRGVLDGMAGDYMERARDVLRRHGDPQGHLRNLERPLRETIEVDLLALQLDVESRLLEHLTPEQLSKLNGKIPWLVQFELSTAVSRRAGERTGF